MNLASTATPVPVASRQRRATLLVVCDHDAVFADPDMEQQAA
jgi:hypothetical protein